MELVISEEMYGLEALTGELRRAAELALEREGVSPDGIEVSLTFVDEEEIRELNGAYRGIDRVTDVLSFPQFESPEDIPGAQKVLLGDVVICRQQAERQAEEYGHSRERELVYLFVHSIFHLLGYDHIQDDDKREMRKAEEEVMARLGLERK
ncbi:MAG: rRNA maturation RNase YbeY [Anaerovoracaceae bacterium]|jgi:probable rRNA maturation factor